MRLDVKYWSTRIHDSVFALDHALFRLSSRSCHAIPTSSCGKHAALQNPCDTDNIHSQLCWRTPCISFTLYFILFVPFFHSFVWSLSLIYAPDLQHCYGNKLSMSLMIHPLSRLPWSRVARKTWTLCAGWTSHRTSMSVPWHYQSFLR